MINGLEGVKKFVSSTFVPEGRVDFRSFRMRSLRLKVTCHSNKDTCLSWVIAQCFNFHSCALKLLQFTRSSGLIHQLDFFTPFQG
jgi:hypothetical protein